MLEHRNSSGVMMPPVGRPNSLSLNKGDDAVRQQFIKDGVNLVHGSNCASLEGVALFRALLPMELIYKTGWFHKQGLASGERGHVFDALFERPSNGCPFHDWSECEWRRDPEGHWSVPRFTAVLDEPGLDAKGVSLNFISKFRDSLGYAKIGADEGSDIFPILYGFYFSEDDLHFVHGHPVSKWAISVDKIRAVYVPRGKADGVAARLRERGLIRLSQTVKIGLCFDI